MRLILLFPLLILSACATPLQQQTSLEAQAWQRASVRADAECTGGRPPKTPVPREKAVSEMRCYQAVAAQEVAPVAAFPDILLAKFSESLKDAEAYSKGELSDAMYEANGKRRWAEYTAAVDSRVAADAQVQQQQFQKSMQGLQDYAAQQQARENELFKTRLMLASPHSGCLCPYDRDDAGNYCGDRSAWSRTGGASGRC